MITWADVVLIAPELSALAVDTQDVILEFVAEQLPATSWGLRLAAGQTYLAAHLGTAASAGAIGSTGPLASESVGDVSRSYAAISVASGTLGETAYGREFDRLKRTLVKRIGIVG